MLVFPRARVWLAPQTTEETVKVKPGNHTLVRTFCKAHCLTTNNDFLKHYATISIPLLLKTSPKQVSIETVGYSLLKKHILYPPPQEACTQYWPAEGQTAKFGEYNVDSNSEDDRDDLTIRKLTVQNRKVNKGLTLKHS